MPFGAGSWCSANRSWWRNGSSTASAICSICVVEAADVGVGDVRHLFEQQVLDLGPRQLLEQQVRADVEAEVVAAADVRAADRVGEFADALLVGPSDDDDAHAVVHHLLHRDDLAGDLRIAGEHDVEALVQHDLGAAVEQLVVDVGVERDAHLASAREDVDRVVVVLADDDAVGRRRLRQLVDLVAQRRDVLARLAQRVRQLLVLADRLRELALRLEQPLLERVHATRGVGEACPEVRDLVEQRRHLPSFCRRSAESELSSPESTGGISPSFAMGRMYTRWSETCLHVLGRVNSSRPISHSYRTRELLLT